MAPRTEGSPEAQHMMEGCRFEAGSRLSLILVDILMAFARELAPPRRVAPLRARGPGAETGWEEWLHIPDSNPRGGNGFPVCPFG